MTPLLGMEDSYRHMRFGHPILFQPTATSYLIEAQNSQGASHYHIYLQPGPLLLPSACSPNYGWYEMLGSQQRTATSRLC